MAPCSVRSRICTTSPCQYKNCPPFFKGRPRPIARDQGGHLPHNGIFAKAKKRLSKSSNKRNFSGLLGSEGGARMSRDLTISEAISDPMIVQLLKADNVPMAAFVQLLQSAARIQKAEIDRARFDIAATVDATGVPRSGDAMGAVA
jgi:hypothetical protein